MQVHTCRSRAVKLVADDPVDGGPHALLLGMPKELVRLASARLAAGRQKVGDSSLPAPPPAAAPAAASPPDDDYLVHTLPPNPGVCDFLLLYPLAIATYFRRLTRGSTFASS